MTHWNRLDIKNATGGKPNKSTRFFFALGKNLAALAYTMPFITIDWNQSASHYQRWNGLTWDSIHRYIMHCIVRAKGANFCSKCKIHSCTFVWFSARSVLNIHPISVCHISNERQQISGQIYDLLSRGYAFWVMIEWIYCTVTFFAHCISNASNVFWEFKTSLGSAGIASLALNNNNILNVFHAGWQKLKITNMHGIGVEICENSGLSRILWNKMILYEWWNQWPHAKY